MTSSSPYLIYNGNCEEAFNMYKSIFKGEIVEKSRFSEMPPQEGFNLPEEEKNWIMHMTLNINDSFLLMGSDTNSYAGKIVFGNNYHLSIDVDSKEEADRVFESLSEGGKVSQAMENTFWGSYFGMCTDKFGVNWMISAESK